MWKALEKRNTPVAKMWRLYSSMLGTTDTIRRLISSRKERKELKVPRSLNWSRAVLTLWYMAHRRSFGPVCSAITRDQTYLWGALLPMEEETDGAPFQTLQCVEVTSSKWKIKL